MATGAIVQSGSQTRSTKLDSASGHLFTFPPFPEPSQGVHIVPFVDFNERGISTIPGPDEVEVDSLGIPTVMMRVTHSTDVCKTKTKRKRPAEKRAPGTTGQKVKHLQWWEVWEETEVIRLTKTVDPCVMDLI